MDTELYALLPDEVEVEKYTGSDGYGGETYSSPILVRARVKGKIQRVVGFDGVEHVSRVQVLLGEVLNISQLDRFTLPERFTTNPADPTDLEARKLTPMAVSSTPDEVGVHHEKAYF